jgi:hypothetical protein
MQRGSFSPPHRVVLSHAHVIMIDRLKFVLWHTGTFSGFTLQFHLLADGENTVPLVRPI